MNEILKLNNQYCFPIYVASKEVIKLYKPALDKLDLTYTQYLTLLVLWESDNILVKELGDKLYLESNTLTPLLKKLEKKGLILKVKDLTDKRKVYIKLSDKGKSLQKEAYKIPDELIKNITFDREKFTSLKSLLKELINNIKDNSGSYNNKG